MAKATEAHSWVERSKPPKKELEHIRLEEAENGGVIATHHFTSYEHKDEPHIFAEGQGEKMVAHLKEHGMMPGGEGGEETETE